MSDLPIVRPRFITSYEIDHPEVIQDIAHALHVGVVTNNGPYVQKFEEALTKYLGAPTICFSSGMAALTAMIMACELEPGSYIACPSFTFPATPHAIRLAGHHPVFVDIGPDLCMDPADLQNAALTLAHYYDSELAAVLAVDPYGTLCDDDRIAKGCAKHGIPFLIDSAPAFGTTGASPRGDAQIFSFHATKPFTTMEGGCLTSRNVELMERARSIRNFSLAPDGNCSSIGFNGKMMEICAIIGLEQLKTWNDTATHRKVVARNMIERLEMGVDDRIQARQPIWAYLPVLIDDRWPVNNRDRVIVEMRKRGIITRAYYSPPCHRMPVYADAIAMTLPVTERVASQVIALPVFNDMTPSEIDRVATALREIAIG